MAPSVDHQRWVCFVFKFTDSTLWHRVNRISTTDQSWYSYCILCARTFKFCRSHYDLYWSCICWTWWRHQMETFSSLLAMCGESTGPQWILLTKASDAVLWYFLCAWTKGWVNNRDVGDLTRHGARYDVTVMSGDHCEVNICPNANEHSFRDSFFLTETPTMNPVLQSISKDGFNTLCLCFGKPNPDSSWNDPSRLCRWIRMKAVDSDG